jgi:hypothetical protein
MFKRLLGPSCALLLAAGLWTGCNSDDEGGPAGPQGGDWELTITVEVNGFALDPQVIQVQMDTPEDYTYTDETYGSDDCTVQTGNGEMTIDCHFEQQMEGSSCTMIVDMNGEGTYTDTTFDYEYVYNYDCGADCSPAECATAAFMAMTVHVVGVYVGE